MRHQDSVILVFLKPFELGAVKTRLAYFIGAKSALEVYIRLVAYTLEQLEEIKGAADVILCFSKLPPLESKCVGDYTHFIQQGDNLGDRMLHALEWAHAEGYRQKIIIGTDCFEVTSDILRQSILALKAKDAVIGPAADGGYYLIGLNEPLAEVFTGVPWSTSETYIATTQKLNGAKLDWGVLNVLSDLDTLSDLKKYPSLYGLVTAKNL